MITKRHGRLATRCGNRFPHTHVNPEKLAVLVTKGACDGITIAFKIESVGHKPAHDLWMPRPKDRIEIDGARIRAILCEQLNKIEVAIIDRPNERIILLFLVDCPFLQENFHQAVEPGLNCSANW